MRASMTTTTEFLELDLRLSHRAGQSYQAELIASHGSANFEFQRPVSAVELNAFQAQVDWARSELCGNTYSV